MPELDEVVQAFVAETYDALEQLASDLVALEREPAPGVLLGRAFRALHTVKGTGGSLGYGALEQLAHAGESVLSALRDGAVPVTQPVTGVLLRLVDALTAILTHIDTDGHEGPFDPAPLLAALAAAHEPPATARRDVAVHVPSPTGAPEDVAAPALGELLVQRGQTASHDVTLAMMVQGEGDARPLGEILVNHGAATASAVADALQRQAEARRCAAAGTVRIDREALDHLAQLAEDLTTTRDQLTGGLAGTPGAQLAGAVSRLDALTDALVDAIGSLRQQPVDSLWTALDRVVRDVAVECGKQVRLHCEGGDVTADGRILDAMRGPLTHCLRNAVDHGIESPGRRAAAGKPPVGMLLVRATEAHGKVVLDVVDDGSGIDCEKVAGAALRTGLVSADHLAAMGESGVVSLVFLPGLSTAARLTRVSGRGVGLDVVKTDVEALGGTVDVLTNPGRGAIFRLTIPRRLA